MALLGRTGPRNRRLQGFLRRRAAAPLAERATMDAGSFVRFCDRSVAVHRLRSRAR